MTPLDSEVEKPERLPTLQLLYALMEILPTLSRSFHRFAERLTRYSALLPDSLIRKVHSSLAETQNLEPTRRWL